MKSKEKPSLLDEDRSLFLTFQEFVNHVSKKPDDFN
jgi:hypothetical protein